jgi:hypothetical protein
MGVFSVYTGIIYNDIFSRSFNIFGSSWTIDGYNISDIAGNAELTLSPYTNFARFNASPYPLGLDPVWQVIIIYTDSVWPFLKSHSCLVLLQNFSVHIEEIIIVLTLLCAKCVSHIKVCPRFPHKMCKIEYFSTVAQWKPTNQ